MSHLKVCGMEINMNQSKLSQHTLKKGKFITPFNSIPQMQSLPDNKSWTYGRLPEYLWIGLIIDKLGRKQGLEKLYEITKELGKIAPNINYPRFSDILSLNDGQQSEFYKKIKLLIPKSTLSPLTLLFTVNEYPVFANEFYLSEQTIENRRDELLNVMTKIMDHQTNESTDIRFIVLWFNATCGNLRLLKEHGDMLVKYPQIDHDNEEMRMIRPFIRSCELFSLDEPNEIYLKKFWRCISKMTDCNLNAIKFPIENANINLYTEYLHEIYVYLNELYKASNPIDEKMSVILGIATYSYKRFWEIYEYKLYNTIVGRSCVRVLIENYIILKYLLKNESTHENIWRDYKIYGIGQYKLILTRHRESKKENKQSHFDMNYIEALVNEFWYEEFIDMDTKYFDKQNIRLKAESVDEKELYGLYYDYDSAFEHGLWGAVRESSLLKCLNPSHQYHCVPDVDNEIQLKSVLPDCIMVMNKTIELLNSLYGIPQQLYKEVVNFEL